VIEFTVYGLVNAWTIWGCDWGPPTQESGTLPNHTARFTWRRAVSGANNSHSDHLSIQCSTFDFEDCEGAGQVLRVYIGKRFAANSCNFLNGRVRFGQGETDAQPSPGFPGYGDPNNCEDYKISRCKFTFDSIAAGDFLDIQQGVKRIAIDGCSFESSHDETGLISMRAFGGTNKSEETEDVLVTNCTFNLTANNVFYDESPLVHPNLADFPVRVVVRNNLFICPESGMTQAHVIFGRAASATGHGYLYRRNVYRNIGDT
jgi:hypothetical protein